MLIPPCRRPLARCPARGRAALFTYTAINSTTDCAAANADVYCYGLRLSAVAFPDGTTVQYQYDGAGNLSAVIYPDGTQRQYIYNEPANICPSSLPGACSAAPPAGGFPHLLTGIADATITGIATRFSTYQYDNRSRVISSSQAGGANALTLSYPSETQATLDFAYGSTPGAGLHKVLTIATVGGLFRKEQDSTDTDPVSGLHSSTHATYDPTTGLLQSRLDANGVQTAYSYDSNNRLTATTSAANTSAQRRTETDWSAAFNVPTERRTKNAGGTVEARTAYAYNSRGQMTARCEIDPADTSYTCSATIAPPSGAQVRRTVTTYCEPADVTAGACPLVGLVTSSNGPRPANDAGMASGQDDLTTYTYYPTTDESGCAAPGGACHHIGDLWKVTNALGQMTIYGSYDKNGRVTRMQDANGTLTDFTYSPRGWLLTRTVRDNASGAASAFDATTTIAYDHVGNVIKVTDPDGAYLAYTYDAAHRLTKIADALGNTLQYTLDAAGNRINENTKDASGTLTRNLSRQIDALNHLQAMQNASNIAVQTYTNPAEAPPSGTTYTNGYDGNGNAIYAIDGNGVGTEQQYDPLNRLVKTLQDHTGQSAATQNTTTQYAYDTRDNLRSVIDPDGLTTNYTYDGLNNLTQLQSPDTGTTNYAYDAAGNRISQTDNRGITSAYTYDALNRLTGITYPTGSLNVTYAYDQPNSSTGCATSYPVGHLTTMTDSTGSTTYCYNRRGNVIRKKQATNSVPLSTLYSYALGDRIQSITYPSGGVATYTRDALGRVTGMIWRQASGGTTSLVGSLAGSLLGTPITVIGNATYYPFGPLNTLTFGNGRSLTKTYDQDYAISQITGSAANSLTLDFGVDVMGNIVAGQSPAGSTNPIGTESIRPIISFGFTYGYDPLYRLAEVDKGNVGPALIMEAYTYNRTGDRLSAQTGGNPAQVYTYQIGTHRLASVDGAPRTTDANGNTLTGTAATLTYDARNRLASATNGASTTHYAYNGRGERVSKAHPNGTQALTLYAYDESGHLIGNYSLSQQTEYLYLDDLPIGVVRDGTLYDVETDHLGTPRTVIDTSGNTVWSWDFFGNAFGADAPNEDPGNTGTPFVFSLRYPGQYFDAETNLHDNYFRTYEPGTGRYTQSDPIGIKATINTYERFA